MLYYEKIIKELSRTSNIKIYSKVGDYLERNHIFYGKWDDINGSPSSSIINAMSTDEVNDNETVIMDALNENDLPFDVCSFEGSSIHLGSNYDDLNIKVKSILAIETSPKCVDYIIGFDINGHFNIRFFEYNDGYNTSKPMQDLADQLEIEDSSVDFLFYGQCHIAVNGCLKKMSKSKMGYERCTRKVKSGSGKSKKYIKIKGIVRVVGKGEERPDPIYGGDIEYSHRWEVRGHWRKISSIGKDRSGEYKVEGYTWVVPFTKGPEDAHLVKKIRVLPS